VRGRSGGAVWSFGRTSVRDVVYQFDPGVNRATVIGKDVPAGGIALCEHGGYVIAATEGMYLQYAVDVRRKHLQEVRLQFAENSEPAMPLILGLPSGIQAC
jgi:hypothetical protein